MSGRVLAALVVLFALIAREAHLSAHGLAAEDAVVTSPETAWRLHRISLAISSPRLAQVDRAISFPSAGDVTQLPIFDELCALGARLALRLSRGDVGESPDPERLERFLRGLGPLLMSGTLLFLYRWLRRRPDSTPASAVAGLALVSCLPGFFELGLPGHLAIEALAALGMVLTLALLEGVWTARDPLDRMTHAMLGGGALGLGLATSPLFVVLLAAALVCFTLDLARAESEERQTLARTALLFWISAALVAQLPTLGGPWVPALEGPVAAWTAWLRELLLLGVLPLVLALAQPRRRVPRAALLGGIAAAGSLSLVLLWDSGAAAMLPALRGGGGTWLSSLAALVGLTVLLTRWRGSARRPSGYELLLVLVGAAGILLACVAPVALVLALVPLASWSADLAQGQRPRRMIWSAAAALLLVTVATRPLPADEQQLREDLVSACAWLEERTTPPGPWGAATAVHAWGVGVEPELAPLVAWHARRAALGLGERWAAGGGTRALAGDLSGARDLQEFGAASRALGLRYWLLTPRAREMLRPSAGGGSRELPWEAQGRVLYRLGEVSILALDLE